MTKFFEVPAQDYPPAANRDRPQVGTRGRFTALTAHAAKAEVESQHNQHR
jgi:hypothetical protein